jgi:hypothetical protein
MGTKVRSAVVVGLLGLLGACTDQGTPAADGSSTPPPPTTTESSAPAGSGECPAGTYQVQSLTAQDSVAVSGQEVRVADVQGLTLAFDADGTWVLTGDGASITVTTSGFSASASVDGTASGDYAKTGDSYAFAQKSADGKITLDQPVAGISSFPMSDFGPAIAPSGTATIDCTATGATITAENATLELTGGSGTGAGTATASTVTEPPAAGEPAPAVFNDSGETGTYSCTAAPVTINGSTNTLTFTGSCKVVNINGGGNTVTVASAGVVNINGGENRLTWTGTEPQIHDTGSGNTVTQG